MESVKLTGSGFRLSQLIFVLTLSIASFGASGGASAATAGQDIEETQGCVRGIQIPKDYFAAQIECKEKEKAALFSKCPTENSPLLVYRTGCKVKYYVGGKIKKVKDTTTGEKAKFAPTGKLNSHRVGDYDHVKRWMNSNSATPPAVPKADPQ